jgi:cellulose synthase/poly-beta-1,6-N-acetylglucosamine synthase-like glycosyltransferase
VLVRGAAPGPAPISIVLPIRDRAGVDVRNALASLAWQTAGRPYEVIIVSHGSTPTVEAELRTLARAASATLIAVGSPDEPWCKPLALNTGILATDPAIAFVMMMDADMILADTMLATVLDELRADADKIVLCQSSDLPEACVLPDEPAAIRARFAELEQLAKLRGTYGTGGIQAVRRSFLVDVRGYDEDMLWWGALDTDLVRRAEASGLTPSWITQRTAMLHQWHPRKHRVLETAARKDEAQSAWLRNHELMIQRTKDVVRNPDGWGATLDR